MQASAVLVCGLCLLPQGTDELVQCASEGSLLSVCPRCFYLRQIGELSASLPRGDATVAAVEDGLKTLYDLVRSRAEEIVVRQLSDAAASGQSESEGRRSASGRYSQSR